jgi:6-phosphofructokinase 1
LIEYAKEQGEQINVKYIDPTYAIRGVPANASDIIYCCNLAQNAVHGVMSGFTAFSIGLI